METRNETSNYLFKERTECTYTSCYCEENVWHLCNWTRENRPQELEKCHCVFISNKDRTIPLWCQKCSQQEDGCVVWDYHVIFLHESAEGTLVYDLDTFLEFPCKFESYAKIAIRSCDAFKEQFHRSFRVIRADEFLSTFASNRSHMLDEKGEWMKPPPDYPCIKTQDCANNMNDFISMDGKVGVGRVMDFHQFSSAFVK